MWSRGGGRREIALDGDAQIAMKGRCRTTPAPPCALLERGIIAGKKAERTLQVLGPPRRRPLPPELPRIDVEVIPVQRAGLDAFKRIGEETSEVVEHRSASVRQAPRQRSRPTGSGSLAVDRSPGSAPKTGKCAAARSPVHGLILSRFCRDLVL